MTAILDKCHFEFTYGYITVRNDSSEMINEKNVCNTYIHVMPVFEYYNILGNYACHRMK